MKIDDPFFIFGIIHYENAVFIFSKQKQNQKTKPKKAFMLKNVLR